MSGGAAGRLLVRRPALGEPVLERVVAALAARADLPLDRLADAQLVASALAAAATRDPSGEGLRVGLDAEAGALALSVGPLTPGAGTRVLADTRVPGVGPVLERLVDRWSVESDGPDAERLVLEIGAGEPAAT